MKKKVLGISGGISFVFFLILLLTAKYLGGNQPSQEMADRWSSEGGVSQVSCFFSVNSHITEDNLREFEYGIDRALSDASVLQESENPGARLWADAYSADGSVTISSDKASIQADAVGIGGDYFLFHPLKLLYGAYFSGNDLMQDYCVIDEDAAWQLFGSSDVAGMMVNIGGVPHIVTGVVERPSGRLEEAAGLDSTLVYVSYQTLDKLGRNNGINHYEIVMPNPVTGFALKYIQENLGTDEKNTEIVENTSRYSFLSRLQRILRFGTRSMNGKAIIYPYWENIARGYEDILTVITLFEMIFLLYPAGMALVFFCIWWRHKGWTIKGKVLKWKDRAERKIENRREEKKQIRQREGGQKKEKRTEKKKVSFGAGKRSSGRKAEEFGLEILDLSGEAVQREGKKDRVKKRDVSRKEKEPVSLRLRKRGKKEEDQEL